MGSRSGLISSSVFTFITMAIAKIFSLVAITTVAVQGKENFTAVPAQGEEPFHVRLLQECDADDCNCQEGCKCLFGCEILGADGSWCASDHAKNIELSAEPMSKMPQDTTSMCELFKCIAYCAKSVGCGQQESKELCEQYKSHDQDCNADCDGDEKVPGKWEEGEEGQEESLEKPGLASIDGVSPSASLGLAAMFLTMVTLQ